MGSRLSQPRSADGLTESSAARPPPHNPLRRPINSRTLVAPAAAATMALLLFVYARTSIRAAKANAQRHRDADTASGGAAGDGISLLNEHRRRHGQAERVGSDGKGTVAELAGELFGRNKKEGRGEDVGQQKGEGRSREEERLREVLGKKG